MCDALLVPWLIVELEHLINNTSLKIRNQSANSLREESLFELLKKQRLDSIRRILEIADNPIPFTGILTLLILFSVENANLSAKINAKAGPRHASLASPGP